MLADVALQGQAALDQFGTKLKGNDNSRPPCKIRWMFVSNHIENNLLFLPIFFL